MIFVAAGTRDGRDLTQLLVKKGYEVTASVVSSYGEKLLEACGKRLVINDEPLDEAGLMRYIKAHDIRLFVDASHPYAVNVSQNAMAATEKLGIPYIRYERDITEFPYEKLHIVHSYEEASEVAARLGKNVFLTTGSRNLQKFVGAPALKEATIFARILPTAKVLIDCEAMGLMPRQLIAMQGPFSKELNLAFFKESKADVVITKNSGTIGGTDTKLMAAKELGLPVVIIDRPKIAYKNLAHTYEEVLRFIKVQD